MGNDVEHAHGYRARFGYPQRLCLVPDLLRAAGDSARSRAPVVVATSRRERSMPLCDDHLGTASAVGLSFRRLTPADEALDTLLDLYGVKELSFLDATIGSTEAI